VVFGGTLLSKAENLLDDEIHPSIIVKGYRLAAEKAKQLYTDIADDIKFEDVKTLKEIALTSMTGKASEGAEELSDLVVQAECALHEFQRRAEHRLVAGHGVADGLEELGANLVRHVLAGGDLGRLLQRLDYKHRAGIVRLEGRIGHLFGDQAGGGALVLVRHGQLVLDGVAGDLQRAGIIAGIDAPDHDGHQHVVLDAEAALQHAFDPRLVLGQQFALDLGLALHGLDVLEAAAILGQLEQHQFVGGGVTAVGLSLSRSGLGG